MVVSTGILIGIAGLCLSAIGMLVAVVFGYGKLTQRSQAQDKVMEKYLTDLGLMFDRLRELEKCAGIMDTIVKQLKSMLENGWTKKIEDIDDRLIKLEQHCKDRCEIVERAINKRRENRSS